MHRENMFVTLTYSDGSLPIGSNGKSTLEPKHLQDWLKRFRKAVAPSLIRFYAVGEYGDESFRPHYHGAIFGFPTCARGRTLRRPGSSRPVWEKCCAVCRLVGDSWGQGDVDLGMLETSSAQYLCGYVTKKMTMRDDPRLEGRFPEFARMSLRPGIGLHAMHEVASQLMRFNLEDSQADVPSALRHGSRLMPLGRYLRSNLRKMVGKNEKAPASEAQKRVEEMRPLREAAFNASSSFKKVVVDVNRPTVARLKARQKIFKGRKSL